MRLRIGLAGKQWRYVSGIDRWPTARSIWNFQGCPKSSCQRISEKFPTFTVSDAEHRMCSDRCQQQRRMKNPHDARYGLLPTSRNEFQQFVRCLYRPRRVSGEGGNKRNCTAIGSPLTSMILCPLARDAEKQVNSVREN